MSAPRPLHHPCGWFPSPRGGGVSFDFGAKQADSPGKHVGHKVAIVERGSIAPAGDFIVGGTVDIMEYRTRQPPPCQFAEIINAVAVVEPHEPAPGDKLAGGTGHQRQRLPVVASGSGAAGGLHPFAWPMPFKKLRRATPA